MPSDDPHKLERGRLSEGARAGDTVSVSMTIGGKSVPGGGRIPVENPAYGSVFAEAPECTDAELDQAVESARQAFAGWARTPLDRRREALLECGRVLTESLDELAELLTREQGKPLRDARAEAQLAADWFGHTARLELDGQTLVDDQAARIDVDRAPVGPVAAIAPSNFPLILAVTKVAPALLAGNSVVLKPSPLTPLSTLLLGERISTVLPPGVVNTVSGGAEVGAMLTLHPAIRLVSFTGSVESGRTIARTSAADFKRVVLELGGNDACIVLPDADVEQVAPRIFQSAMANSGQFCAAVKRVYAPRGKESELAEVFSTLAQSVRLGDGMDPATDLGPLVSERQLARVVDLVSMAGSAGARVLTGGGQLPGPGYFYRPTVVTGLPPGSPLEREEQFGPVLPVLSYETVAQAVDRANSTHFGLGGSVWGSEKAATEVAADLDCGTVWINTHGDLRPTVPFGGWRSSGIGLEYGYWGLLEYTRARVTNVAHPCIPGTADTG